MTFHAVDNDNRVSLADFSDFATPSTLPKSEEDDIDTFSEILDFIGVAESQMNEDIDEKENVTSVFEQLGIPQRDDASQW